MDTLAELKEDEDRREGFLDPFTILDAGPPPPTDDGHGGGSAPVDFGTPAATADMIKQVAAMLGVSSHAAAGSCSCTSDLLSPQQLVFPQLHQRSLDMYTHETRTPALDWSSCLAV